MQTTQINTDLSLVEEITNLEATRDCLQEEIAESQRFLEQAKATQKKTGEYTNPTDWANARGIVRDKTNELHSINRKLKELNKELSSRTNSSRFQRAAKEILDPTMYQSIVDTTINGKT